jgi:rubrerythrin
MEIAKSNEQLERQQRERELTKIKLSFARQISEAGRREQQSLTGYYELLDNLTPYFVENHEDPELMRFKADIEEIVGDELNHVAKLQAWAIKLGGVKEDRT